MTEDAILRIEIDKDGRLCVQPETQEFKYIYRAAMDVAWDVPKRCLCSPKPREWTYPAWFRHIAAAAAQEYGVRLMLTSRTEWVNIPDDLRLEIESSAADQP